MRLPKDLENIRDFNTGIFLAMPTAPLVITYKQGFDEGAQAVLEHEQIKKLEEMLKQTRCTCPILTKYDSSICKRCETLTDFRAWRDQI